MADRVVVEYVDNISSVIASSEKYVSTLKATDEELKKVNATAAKGRADLESQAKSIESTIKAQEESIKRLNKELSNTAPGVVQRDLKRTIGEVTSSMEIQKKKLEDINTELNRETGILQVLRKRTKDLQDAREKAEDPKRIERINGLLKKNNERVNELTKSAGESNKAFGGLEGILKKISVAAIIAFATKKIVEFGKEAFDVALKAEGIVNAFEKLDQPDLLEDLRAATSGTVSDLELMKAAVQAKNFDVPLEQLATLFEFAAQRASDTGQNVNDLVRNIVDGIGRKSVLVIDNLGISADRVSKEFKRTGDFAQATANIIEEEMAKSGASVETTATKTARLATRFENFKLGVGNILLQVADPFISFLDDVTAGFEHLVTGVDDTTESIIVNAQELEKFQKTFEVFTLTLPQTQEQFESQVEAAKLAGLTLEEYRIQLAANIKEQTAAKEAYAESQREQIKQIITIESLKEEIKLLQDAYEKAEVGTSGFTTASAALIAKQAELDAALGKTNKALDKQLAELEKIINAPLKEPDDLFKQQANLETSALEEETEKRKQIAKDEADYKKQLQDEATEAQEKTLEEDRAKTESEKRIRDLTIQYRQETYNATYDLLTSLAQLSQENSNFQKAVILTQLLLDTASAISSLTRASEANPANAGTAGLAGAIQFATGLIRIGTNIAKAKELLSQAPTPTPAFKEGVIDYKGKGTETSDDNVVRISNRESVITARGTRKHSGLLAAINDDNESALSDIIMKNYMPKGFADSIRDSVIYNFSTTNVEGLLRDSIKSNRNNTKVLAGVIQTQSKEARKNNYINRKQSNL